MSSVVELFATLGIKVDQSEWAKADRKIDDFDRKVNKRFAGLKKSLGAGFGVVGAQLISGVTSRIGGALRAAGEDALDFNEQLTRLDIASRGAMGSVDQVQDQILALSKATGVAKEELARGAAGFISLTGDAKATSDSLETFARVAKASGASMEDITASAAAMQQNLKIDSKDFEKAFSVLIASGKAGAIELKDVAGLMAEIAPLAERFAGGSGVQGLTDLSAALQLTRQGAGSAGQAATQLSALMGAIVKNAGRLEKSGVKVFTKDAQTGEKTLRSFQEIVASIGESKLAKDPTLLIKALGRKEAEAAFIQLTKVDGAWQKLADSTRDANDVAEDYDKFQRSSSAKVSKAWNKVKVAIAEAFTPERVETMASALEGVAEAAGSVVDGLDEIIARIERIISGDSPELASSASSTAIKTARAAGMSNQEIAEKGFAGSGAQTSAKLKKLGVPASIRKALSDIQLTETETRLTRVTPGSHLDDAFGWLGMGDQRLFTPGFVPEPTIPQIAAREGSRVVNNAPTFNLEVNAPNANAAEVAREVQKKVREFWDSQMRILGQ